jgi:hypothetical protein
MKQTEIAKERKGKGNTALMANTCDQQHSG